MSADVSELLRRALPLLEQYATMLRRKGNQPAMELMVREFVEQARRALMERTQ